MTELEQKADGYVKDELCSSCVTQDMVKLENCEKSCKARKIYIDGYEQGQFDEQMKTKCIVYTDNSKVIAELEKENAELKAQIEKMKNMQNCKHNWESKGQCVFNNNGYCICDKWELAE